MPPRIAYWTSSFEPDMEAVASELAILRRHFRSSVAWGLSHRHWVLLSQRRGYCLNPRLQLLFRLAANILESVFDINHIVGSLGDWFYLRDAKSRPTILTVATVNTPVSASLLKNVVTFVVEYPGGKEQLQELGISSEKIRLIFPATDFCSLLPAPRPEGPFTVLFASSPEMKNWLPARGVPQILEAAKLLPEVRFRLLWRPWGTAGTQVREWIVERQLHNVEVVVKCSNNMAQEYANAHVTVAPFTDASRSKPAPNSIIESMACGRPVLATEVVGLANLIRERCAGVVCEPTGEALAESLEVLQRNWFDYSVCARGLAERLFSVEKFIRAYGRLYDEILQC